MKKFLMALAATTMVATPMVATQAQAAPRQQHRVVEKTVRHTPNGRVVVKQKTVVRKNDRFGYGNQRRWAKGQRFDRRQASSYRVINNPRAYRLNSAPRGYQWVQSGNDAVMIALASGIIGAVIGNAIH